MATKKTTKAVAATCGICYKAKPSKELEGVKLCGACYKKQTAAPEPAPVDAVLRTTELEAAKFAAMDAELRNCLLSQKTLDYEMQVADRAAADYMAKHQSDQANRRAHRERLTADAARRQKEYQEFVVSLATKYGLDPKQFSIDPESRVLRDLRGESTRA